MKVNYKLSAELKKKYRHRIRQCYMNASRLLIHREVDYYVLGYVLDIEKNIGIRHCWGVKDNEIVDSTFGNKKEYITNIEYYEAFEIHREDLDNVMLNYNPDLKGYNEDAEEEVRVMLMLEFGLSSFY